MGGDTQDTVLAAAFSPCGGYLACATASGKLHIWRTDDFAAVSTARLDTCAIYAITFLQSGATTLLASGSDEEVRVWSWDALLSSPASPKPRLQLQNPRSSMRRGGVGPLSETSAVSYDAASGAMYTAAGDGNAYCWDLSAGKIVTTFSGHTDQLHCLELLSRSRQIATGSEDGSVRLWDVRTASTSHVLRPDAPPLVDRPAGKAAGGVGAGWCGCMAVDAAQNWLVAGWGGGFICSIELATLACVACVPTAAAPQAVCFEPASKASVLSVGAEPGMYHWALTGKLHTRATCSSPSAFGLAACRTAEGGPLVAVGGTSPTVDIYRELSHRALALAVPGP